MRMGVSRPVGMLVLVLDMLVLVLVVRVRVRHVPMAVLVGMRMRVIVIGHRRLSSQPGSETLEDACHRRPSYTATR
jgi:hypothetical protein